MIPWSFGRNRAILVLPFEFAPVGHVSYLLVDAESRTAAVIDPQPDVDPYLEQAARFGARIRHVFLTKQHSDFEAGHLALADQTGAVIYLGSRARASFPHLPVKEGDALQFGSTELRILETPGHTVEGIALVASDVSGPPEALGLFSGDLIFEGDLARPEPRLDDGLGVAELGALLHHSIHAKILRLDPDARLFSGHRVGPSPLLPEGFDVPTLSAIRRRHPLLRPQSPAAFVAAVTAGMIPAPITRGTRNRLNRADGRASAPPRLRHLTALSAPALLSMVDQGAVAIDLREPMEFAASHLRGSLSLGLGSDFESWASAVLDPTDDHVLITNPGSEEEAALRLRSLLGTRIRGFLEGGMTALEHRTGLLEQTPQAFIPRAGRGGRSARVDVRSGEPFERDSAGGGRRLPLEDLLGRLGEMPGPGGSLAVVDEDPYRAQAAASLLRRRGWPGALPAIAAGPPPRLADPRPGAP